MGFLQEGAIFIGDHITAPIRAKLSEARTGQEVIIVRTAYRNTNQQGDADLITPDGHRLEAGQKFVEWTFLRK